MMGDPSHGKLTPRNACNLQVNKADYKKSGNNITTLRVIKNIAQGVKDLFFLVYIYISLAQDSDRVLIVRSSTLSPTCANESRNKLHKPTLPWHIVPGRVMYSRVNKSSRRKGSAK